MRFKLSRFPSIGHDWHRSPTAAVSVSTRRKDRRLYTVMRFPRLHFDQLRIGLQEPGFDDTFGLLGFAS